eukprot:5425245-Pleurochrysis_carterae.AAC.3
MADATSKAELSEPCPATFLTSTPNWDDGAGRNERRLASTPRESVHGLVHPAPSRRGLQTAQGSRSTDARQALPDVQPKGSRTPRGTSTRLSELPLVTPNQLRDRARHLSERRNRAQAGSLDTPDYSLPSSIRMGTSAIQKHLRGQKGLCQPAQMARSPSRFYQFCSRRRVRPCMLSMSGLVLSLWPDQYWPLQAHAPMLACTDTSRG